MGKFKNKIKNMFSFHMITSFKCNKKKKDKNLTKREKVLKYTAIVLFPVLAITSGVVLGFREYNKEKNKIITDVTITTDEVKRKIFLVSNDNYTIPITVNMNQRSTLQQEIMDVFDLLKTSSKANSKYVTGFINDNTKINSFNLENKTLELNLSDDIFDTKLNSVNIIEALTLTYLQFDEIESLRLLVDGKEIKEFNSTPLPSYLDYKFGINQQMYSIRDIIGKQKVVIFGKRIYDADNQYLIPVSVYANRGESNNITFANAVKQSFPASTQLKKVDLYQGINAKQDESEDFSLSINSSSLSDENYVNRDLFDLVNMSLDFMDINETVNFTLEGESIQVDGVYELESYSVSSCIINEIQI